MFASAKFRSAFSLVLLLTLFCSSASNAETTAKQIQKHLSSLGYNIGAIDGIFGNLSRKALAKHLGVKPKDLPKNWCCQTNANSSLFGQSGSSVILQEDRATRSEQRCGFA